MKVKDAEDAVKAGLTVRAEEANYWRETRWNQERSCYESRALGLCNWGSTNTPWFYISPNFPDWQIVSPDSPKPKEGTQEWAREQAKAGELVWYGGDYYYGHDKEGFFLQLRPGKEDFGPGLDERGSSHLTQKRDEHNWSLYDGSIGEPKEGSQAWAQARAREGKLVWVGKNYCYGHNGKRFFGRIAPHNLATESSLLEGPESENFLYCEDQAHRTDWTLYQGPGGKPPTVEKIGVKLLTKDGRSGHVLSAHRGSLQLLYPTGTWILAPGQGAYVCVDGAKPSTLISTSSSLLSGGSAEGLVVTYFECAGLLGPGPTGVERFRWVRRLDAAYPTEMPASFHSWVRSVSESFSVEQAAALLPEALIIHRDKEPEWVVERCPVRPSTGGLNPSYLGFDYRGGFYSTVFALTVPGFWRFEFELPSGETTYGRSPVYYLSDGPEPSESGPFSDEAHAIQAKAVLFKTLKEE